MSPVKHSIYAKGVSAELPAQGAFAQQTTESDAALSHDYSAAMLRLFLQGQIVLERCETGCAPQAARAAVKRRLSKATRVSQLAIEGAMKGWVSNKTRLKLWRALGVEGAQ